MDHLLLLSAAAMLAVGAPLAAAMASENDIAPTGKLLVAVALSPAPGPFWAGRDPATGQPKGVSVDLGKAMADKLKVPLELVVYENSGAITDAGASNAWDVTFVPMDAERAKRLDFGPVYNIGESTFLVRPGAPIEKLADVDKAGVKVLGISATTTIRATGAWLKNTQPIPVGSVEAVMEQLKSGQADAFAMSRDALTELSRSLPGSRVLDGYSFQAKTATAVPRGHAAALAFVTAFVEDAKKSGLMRRVLDANGLQDQAVAP
jgi:polar amino acid transport system substrate-binding protein